MPVRRGVSASAVRQWARSFSRFRPSDTRQRVLVLAALLLLVTTAFLVVNHPGLGIFMYALLPIVLAVYWFHLRGGLLTALAAVTVFVGVRLAVPSMQLARNDLWLAALNRAAVFLGVAALVSLLLRRERELADTVRAQRDAIAEFESLRAALTPSEIPARPHLEFATSFTPAEGLVAGDFFLVVDGPSDSTTIAVGDVVGHGLEAARGAAFVRAALATFARFTSDPVELLQLANAALVEHEQDDAHFVTAVCLNIGPPPDHQVRWATAGHDVPWFLDTAEPLPGGRVGTPLGIGADALRLEAGRASLRQGAGILLFTDGLLEGRRPRHDTSQRLELFGEDRARRVVRDNAGAAPAGVIDSLVAEVVDFSGGSLADDLCMVAVRARYPGEPAGGPRPAP